LVTDILQTSRTPAAALHDLDANKPGGSIKIRVKTYAHSLRLQQERLEDLTSKKRELTRRIEEKRLELLRMKQAQLESVKQKDPALEQSIVELAEKLRAYAAPPAAAEPAKGMVQLGKKLADGSIQRLTSTPAPAATSATAAE
jgi:chromosome segregation ATPase